MPKLNKSGPRSKNSSEPNSEFQSEFSEKRAESRDGEYRVSKEHFYSLRDKQKSQRFSTLKDRAKCKISMRYRGSVDFQATEANDYISASGNGGHLPDRADNNLRTRTSMGCRMTSSVGNYPQIMNENQNGGFLSRNIRTFWNNSIDYENTTQPLTIHDLDSDKIALT